MTDVERMHEERINALDTRVEVLSQKVDDFIAESRANAARQEARMEKLDERLEKLNARIDSNIHQMRNMTIASMVGIGAMAISSGAIAVAVIMALFR